MPVTDIARRLKARAFQLDMSPASVAAASKLNRSFIYDILRGKSVRPSRAKLEKVAAVLRVDVDWLDLSWGNRSHGAIGRLRVTLYDRPGTLAASLITHRAGPRERP